MDEIERLEQERKLALSTGDSKRYAKLCDELGVSPERPEFYEQGLIERGGKTLAEQEPFRNNYNSFLEACARKRVNLRDFAKDSKDKRSLLEEQFPRRFGKQGEQPLSGYNDKQVGSLFQRIYAYAEKIAQK